MTIGLVYEDIFAVRAWPALFVQSDSTEKQQEVSPRASAEEQPPSRRARIDWLDVTVVGLGTHADMCGERVWYYYYYYFLCILL